MKRLTSLWALVAGLFLLSACSSDNGPSGEGGQPGESLQAALDQTEYYPFDVVTVQLPVAATGETYNGLLGTRPVKAQRIADSTLVVLAPDLEAGEYTLSLQIGNSTAESTLKIKEMPAVSNPETVIAGIKTACDQAVAEAEQEGDPNATLLAGLVEAFNTQVSQMSEAERKQLAAYWQLHPEWQEDAFPRAAGSEDLAELRAAIKEYKSRVVTVKGYVFAFSAALITLPASGVVGGGVAVIAGIKIIQSSMKLVASTNRLINRAFIVDEELGLKLESVLNKKGYDYTLQNGGTLAFDVRATYRSVAARDISGAAPSEAKEIISSTTQFQTIWDNIANGINTLRNYCTFVGELAGRPQKVSEITEPATETGVVPDWTLRIVSGNVSAQKSGTNGYKFTTTVEEDVEFTFKITTEGLDSDLYSALLEATSGYTLTGKWKGDASYKVVYDDGRTEIIPVEETYYTFINEAYLVHEWINDLGSNKRNVSYGYDKSTNTGSIFHGAVWHFTMESETTFVQTYSSGAYGQSIYWYFRKIE